MISNLGIELSPAIQLNTSSQSDRLTVAAPGRLAGKPNLKKRTLLDFPGVHINTAEERRMQIEREFERDREKRAKIRKIEEQLAEKKKASKREESRLRKQKSRAMKRQKEIDAGIRDENGKKVVSLTLH
jgi:septal ring factor EnvC (AmiA/AmiB activator)